MRLVSLICHLHGLVLDLLLVHFDFGSVSLLLFGLAEVVLLNGISIGRSFWRFLIDGIRMSCLAQFIFGRLLLMQRTLPAVNVLLIGLENDVIVEGVLIKILLLAGLEIPTDFVVRVDGLVVTIDHMLHLLLRLLFILLIMLVLSYLSWVRVLEYTNLLSLYFSERLPVFLFCEVAAVLGYGL